MKDFTTYDQALALKELGFKEGCIAWFDPKTKESNVLGQENPDKWHLTFDNPEIIQRPTYSQAFRWFRNNFNLEYHIAKSPNGNYYSSIHKNTDDYIRTIMSLGGYEHSCLSEVVDCYTYEEAESACLDHLIKIVKDNL